jgi:hypothetical protein
MQCVELRSEASDLGLQRLDALVEKEKTGEKDI